MLASPGPPTACHRPAPVNRKQFLLVSGMVATGATLSLLLRSQLADATPPLQQPWFLAHLFDRRRLLEIGAGYRIAHPAEDSVSELTRLLLGRPVPPGSDTDDATISRQLQRQVQEDFAADRLVMVEGWVLSITEARQCAIFSILTA